MRFGAPAGMWRQTHAEGSRLFRAEQRKGKREGCGTLNCGVGLDPPSAPPQRNDVAAWVRLTPRLGQRSPSGTGSSTQD